MCERLLFKTRERGKKERKWDPEGGFAGVVISVFPGFGCGWRWDVHPGIWGEVRGWQGCSQPGGAGADWALLFIGPKK